MRAARERAGAALYSGVTALPGRQGAAGADPGPDALAAWSIVHGFATLWLSGALPDRVGDDPREAARVVVRRFFS